MRALLALLLFLLLPLAATAQDRAALVADRVEIAGDDRLIAEGSVEVFFKGRRLRASRIVYDRSTDRLLIEGPITLTDAGGTIILADQADLAADLSEGILISARMVLNEQLQLAASEIMRVGGRYTRLGRTVASSCKVCAGDPTPLWEIRARRVVHDEVERQLYFDSAQLRIAGLPVFWIPRLRMPDPTRDRSTGFLIPALRSTSALGTGVRLPYFIALGPHKDLTITPFLSTKGGRTVELRYRQAFVTGEIELRGALSRDEIRLGETRGFAQAEGTFRLPAGFRLDFFAETVSDRGYLLDYGLGERDRLTSRLSVERVRRDEWILARLRHTRSLREGDDNDVLPSLVADLTWQRRFAPALVGGLATLTFQSQARGRVSQDGGDSDGDGISDGRDTGRVSLLADWRRDAVFGPGIQATALAALRLDHVQIRQDDAEQGGRTRLYGAAGVEFRWPFTRTTARGATQVIEPVVQLIWSPGTVRAVPNEDSLLAEFDEDNLFALHRLPGADAVERGARANLGLSFTHYAPAGWEAGLTFGRILRTEPGDVFSAASGLSGSRSDWLVGLRLAGDGLGLTNRLVFSDGFSLTRGEVRLDLVRDRFSLAGSYVWVPADASEGRDEDVEEILFDASYDFSDTWTGRLTTRYDFDAGQAASTGVTFAYRNECLAIDLSLSRRFTTSTSVQPTTDVGLSVQLLGFGGTARPGPSRTCRG